MKLKIKLTVVIIAMMLVIIAAISMVLLSRARSLQIEAAQRNMESLIGLHAKDLQARYQAYYNSALAASQIFDSFANVDAADRRRQFNNILLGILESNPRYVGMFTVWKPGVIDNLSAQFANTQGSDAQGNYITLYTRENGSIELRSYPDAQRILDNLSPIPTIADPEYRMVSGQNVLVSEFIVPIILDTDKSIAGAVGIIVNLSASQPLIAQIRPYETGFAGLFAADGTIIAHYYPDRTGKDFREASLESMGQKGVTIIENSLFSGEPAELKNGGAIIQSYPFYIGDAKTAWAIVGTVPLKTVNAAVNALTRFTVIFAAAAVIVAMCISFFIAASIARPIINVSKTLKDISEGEGDLTKQIKTNSKDEIGDLSRYFNLTLEKIKTLIITIKAQSVSLFDSGTELASNMTETAAAVNQITANIQSIKGRVINQSASISEANATMEQITVNINKLNERIEDQTASVSESSSAIEEMLANIQSVTQTLVSNAENIKDLTEASEVGRMGLQKVAEDIQGISRESEGLLEINAVMENIASQTNLLSMNAAIEAAHAGEAGKGFAVVADEIRKLAENSGDQSKTISAVLKKIKEAIDTITGSIEEVLTKFGAIDHEVKTVSDQASNIRNAMEEQGEGSKQILESIGQLNEITQQVKGGSTEMLEGSRDVIQESKNLELVTQEISNGMNEMSVGADQINEAVNRVSAISNENKNNIDVLVKEVSKFKVE
ncbi:MAG: methyl-accepting chemotaxis protein [Treponema sp.]|jgi:methyl-accepting chemotaxis protein|nr:methyl-accepting chemotaxis protein [Treponema sp.]